MQESLKVLKYSLDPIAFIKEILGLQCKDFHKEWIELFENNKYVSLLAPRGHGKELADSTPILTPSGWKTHGDLKIGDYVFHPSGKPVKIIGTNKKLPADYVVETRNGESIRCHANHEWYVYDRNLKRFIIKETKDMVGEWNNGTRSRYQLSNIKELNFNKKELPLDPYYIGLWLGDGTSTDSSIVCSESDISTINSIPYKKSYKYIHPKTKVLKFGFANNGIIEKLRLLNLYNNKHIPNIYLQGSVEQRLELLAGLIDSDGSFNKKRGRYRFVNTNYNLIKGVEELCIGLGLRPYITSQEPHSNGKGIDGKLITYTINFNNNIKIPTRLKRKRDGRVPKENRIGIISVRYEPNGELGNCIQVDSDDGLYLAGKKLIVTHNSVMIGAYLTWRIVKDPNIRILTITINQDKANEMMTLVQRALEGNEKLIEIYGPQRGYTDWSRSTLRVLRAGKTGIAHKEPTFSVLGVTASMVGGHYDIIVLDDITDHNNSRTEHRRKELESLYNMTVTPMLEPNGQIISVGTRWHEADIHSYFRGLNNYTCKLYKAILDEESDPPKVLWPEQWPYDKLMQRKTGMGSLSFEMQYQNEIISSEDSPIKRDWVEYSIQNYKMIPQPFDVYMGVDLASKGEESDFFSITMIGVHEGNVYVLDGLRTKASLFRQFELIKSFDAKWQPVRIGIEQAAQQKMIVDQLTESTTLPIVPIKSSIVNDRMSRVQRLSVLFETGRILLNPSMMDWANELIVFPRGSNDDTLDSLCFAIQASHLEDEESTIDWNEVASMITTKKTVGNKPHVKNYKITKL